MKSVRPPNDVEDFVVVFVIVPVGCWLALQIAAALAVNLTRWSSL